MVSIWRHVVPHWLYIPQKLKQYSSWACWRKKLFIKHYNSKDVCMVCQYTFGFYSTNLSFVRGLGRCPRWLHMLLHQSLIIWLKGNHFYRSNCQWLQHVSTKRFRISHTPLTVTVLQHTWCIYIGHMQIFSQWRQSIYSHKPWLLRPRPLNADQYHARPELTLLSILGFWPLSLSSTSELLPSEPLVSFKTQRTC